MGGVQTDDGSGYTVDFIGTPPHVNLTVYDKAGNNFGFVSSYWSNRPFFPGTVKTPDGVSLTSTSNGSTYTITDALSSSPVLTINQTGGLANSYAYTDINNDQQEYTVAYTSYTQATNFACSGLTDYGPLPVSLPTTLTIPHEGSYSITYETTPNYSSTKYPPPYTTGRVASITFPSGGSISYTYTGGNNGINCKSFVVPTLTRTVNDNNGNVSTWKYVNSNSGATNTFNVAETDAAGNQTVFTFYLQMQVQVSKYQGGCPTSISGCNGGGTLSSTVTTCYSGNFTNCLNFNALSVTFPISQTDVYTSYNGGPNNLVETKWDTYGNVAEVKRYDFGVVMGAAPTGQPLSTLQAYYGMGPWNGSTCAAYPSGAYIFATPCYTYTTNSAGTTVAQTKITYSSTGHPVSTAKWTSGSSWLTSTATYNSNGTISTAYDVNGALSSYAYNGTDGCNGLLPTSVTVTGTGLPSSGLITSTQWNCAGGLVTQTSDSNQQATSYTYNDPLWRQTSITDPLLNVTSMSYPTSTTYESAMNFGTTSTADKLVTTDGLARQIVGQTRQAQGATNFDSTQTIYGWTVGAGPFTKVSMPYTGAAGQAAPGGTPNTTTQNDALNRPLSVVDGGSGTVSYTYVKNDVLQSIGPTQTFQKQFEYDGLGRLTSVCEITSVAGSGNCGQSNPATGFLTKYTYDALGNLLTVAQNVQPGAIGAPQSRTYTYDGLSRLLSETNPEWGPGAATYTYDVACGAFPASAGDRTKSTDNAGNPTCYNYDALHRVTDIIVSQNSSCVPPVKRFRYDTSANAILPLPSGYSATNTSGQMIEAWTGDCVWPTPASGADSATDEWLAYSARGRRPICGNRQRIF